MRVAVTGKMGQVVSALIERCSVASVEVVALGRPELDLAELGNVEKMFDEIKPDVIVSAAAYTAVDKAESEPELAFAINGTAPGTIAGAARALGVPLIHISTDYVFDGSKASAWTEGDSTGPLSVYGASKLAGERAVLASGARAAVLRVAWVYAPFGANFVKTMLRLAKTRDRLGVVADQFGAPTSALDIADGIFAVAKQLAAPSADASLEGVFHMGAGGPDVSWADFAEAIFDGLAARGSKRPQVDRITTVDYPTPAKRPVQSRLESSKLASTYDIALPDWRQSLDLILDRLVLPVDPAQAEGKP